MTRRLVVIGGDAAGMSAASQARRGDPSLEIVALEKGDWTSYSACGIPYHVAGDVERLDDLVARTPQQFRDRLHIDVRMHHEVMGIDTSSGQVEVRDHDHERTVWLDFDALMIGTGAKPRRPDIPGINGESVLGVQTLNDAQRLLDRAESSRCEDVAVIGGGYIGLEMAEAFVRWGARVTVVDSSPEVMRTLDPEMGARVRSAMESAGIDVRCGRRVTGIEPGAVHTGDEQIAADLVVLGMGVVANTDLAVDAGIPTGDKGAIRVNRRQEAEVDGVWSAGDCADTLHLLTHERIHLALGTVANRTGRVAGINLGGGDARFPGAIGTAITKVCATEIARTGLCEHEARRAGFAYEVETIESSTRAGYFPGAAAMATRMLAESATGRIIGAQIVGGEGAAKRIDTVAAAITAGMTAQDLVDLDTAYAPPFSPVWDPVQVAARRLLSRL